MITHIYNSDLIELENQLSKMITEGKYDLINIVYVSPSTFSSDNEDTQDGWYAILKSNK